MNGKRLMAMGLIVALSVSAIACGKTEETEEVSKIAVEVQNPETGELTVDTTYIGTVSPQEQVYVIPKASGTVTETFFDVGDTVQEGDVLFTIDDEAYQLQLASAEASYEYAQAGVTAQTGGARHLQNYQTEEQIQQLYDTLSDTYENKEDMEDDLDDLRDSKKKLTSAQEQAQQAVASLTEELEVLNQDLGVAQDELEKLKNNSTDAGDSIGTDETPSPAVDPALTAAEEKVNSITANRDSVKSQLAEAQAQLETAQTSLASVESGKTQLKSAIDQLETSQETLEDNISTAEQSYAITQNEIYPQTDATYAAQLQQAAVGIDSAQMQLDYCTVTAPISGIVESVSVEKNGMAAAGNVAYIISNKDSMKVTFNVTETAKNTLQIGDHITVERNGQTFDGTITEIGTMAGQQSKLFEVEATVTGAGDSLPNGVSAKVYATTQRAENKLIVPYDALYFSAGDAYVWCVKNGQIVKTDVTVGLMNDTQAVIEEGLTADSMVISNWSSKLRNGAEAEIISLNGEPVETEEEPQEEVPAETEEAQEGEETPETSEAEETPAEADVTEEAE